MNMLMAFARSGRRILEVPIETIYLDGNRSSHFHLLRDSFLIYKEILKFSAASFASFLLDYSLYALLMALSHSLILSNVLLSLGILAAGTLGLNILVQGLGINYLIAKIIIEGILFFTSYFVQKRWIFSGKEVLE